jgi:hypothetical protein
MTTIALTTGQPRAVNDAVALSAAALSLALLNGHPYWLSNAVVCALAAAAVLIRRAASAPSGRTPQRSVDTVGLLLAALTLVASVSTAVNLGALTAINLVLGYAIPLALYFAASQAILTRAGVRWIVVALAAGLVARFGAGLVVFADNFGVPSSPVTVFFMRDEIQASDYVKATFGNTGNTAALIAVTLPVLLAALTLPTLGAAVRLLVAAAVVLLLLNAIITGSRGVLSFSMLALVAVLAFFAGRRAILACGLVLLGIAYWLSASPITDLDLDQLIDYFTFAGQSDSSAIERTDSIAIGLETIRNHPLGVGPNRSVEVNEYSVPHQFALNQASDVGFIAIGLWTLTCLSVLARVVPDLAACRRRGVRPAAIFSLATAIWLLYGMTLNIATTSGTCISWIGLFALYAGLANNPTLRTSAAA